MGERAIHFTVMRISPKSLSPSEALAKAKASAAIKEAARLEAVASEAAETAAAPKTSPVEIDARRAQQLLERAASLAERGDMGAAVLATRQSLALAPGNVTGHLQLAGLLERNRDFGGARAAYEKSVQLAPDRADARDNLTRLNVYLEKSQGAARQFQFDANELFDPANPVADRPISIAPVDAAPVAAAPIAAAPVAAAPIAAAPVLAMPAQAPIQTTPYVDLEMFDESMLPSIEARLPPSRAEDVEAKTGEVKTLGKETMAASKSAANEATTGRSEVERRKHNVPVATERRRRPAANATVASALAPAPFVPTPVANASVANASVANVASKPATAAPLRPRIFPSDGNGPTPVATRATGANMGAGASADASAFNVPLTLDLPPASAPPLWQQVIERPSFYARTLPLVGVALLSLGFLGWARGRVVSQVVAPASVEIAQAAPDATAQTATGQTATGQTATAQGAQNVGQQNPPDAASSPDAAPSPGADGGGFPISNAPFTFQAPPANSAPNTPGAPVNNAGNRGNFAAQGNNAPATTARASNRAANRAASQPRFPARVLPPARPVPNFPSVSLAPAPILPGSIRSPIAPANSGQNGGNIILPSPSIDLPSAPVTRQRVLPPGDNALNPAGSPNRGYVRVTEGRVGNGVIPTQPSNVARDNERSAGESARNGQTEQAISQMSQAIRADSDNAGFRYQQRATLFLQRGDYNRASDDFQSAISAYQNQIGRGDDVAQAKRGLNSARSGLALALAGKRNG